MDHGEGSSSLASTEHLQVHKQVARVGVWGSKAKGTEANHWSFRFNNNHKLKKIAIDHGDLIYSLMYTTEDGRGCLHDSKKAGGWNGGCKVTKITFDCDEEITGIAGTVGVSTGVYAGYTIISSLSFITNKRTHGPFGKATGTHFSVPWSKGSFVGFYGRCGYYIDAIGVYLKASKEPAQVGVWGSKAKGTEANHWSFRLNNNHKLKKIAIDHGDLIYSLMFTTEDGRGCLHDSKTAGGWNGGCKVTKITFDCDEEITGIAGTVGVSTGVYAGYTIISSLSFITNKRTHGPFGKATGSHFSVPWSKGSFAGFYGLCGYYIDAIGVYLKATA